MAVQSCCCFDLVTGGKIIGWLGVVVTILSVIGVFIVPQSHEYTAGIIFGVIAIILLCGSIYVFLLIGIDKQKQGYLLPYLIVTPIGIVGYIIKSIYECATYEPKKEEVDPTAGIVIGIFIGTGLGIYFWMVIQSLYLRFGSTNGNRSLENPTYGNR